MKEILPIAHAITNNLLKLLKAGAALPARLEVRADLASLARRHFAVGVSHQLVIFWMMIHSRLAHRFISSGNRFRRTMARRRNSPTVEALIPKIDPICG